MMEVSPFRGIRYNQVIVGGLARIICPPYDVVAPEQRKLYHEKSDYNAIRLESPADSPEPADDSYGKAATTFQQWLNKGVLQLDDTPGFYLHDHHFEYAGEKRVRRGLIARVELQPWGSGIYPHEETFPKAKSDRLQLMRACRATFSPLLSLYQGSEPGVALKLSEVAQGEPIIQTAGSPPSRGEGQGGEGHVIWAITDPETKMQLSQFLSSQPLYIADGHHRYETALAYQRERAQHQSVTGKEVFNYVMMELVDFSTSPQTGAWYSAFGLSRAGRASQEIFCPRVCSRKG
jgi:uncharacterized protein (DUF1015 family)